MKLTILSLLLPVAACSAAIQLSSLTFVNANGEAATYHGSPAVKMTSKDGTHQAFAVVRDLTFRDGTIEVDVSGAPAKGAADSARGFIGVVFRQQKKADRFEIIYVRPTNARTGDQERRNHTVQYSSEPDWSWERLRKETPGMYESYADMQAGEWTHLRIVVHGRDASLYVNHAAQPCLIVHDLKLGETQGAVALWIGSDTEGYFRDLQINPR